MKDTPHTPEPWSAEPGYGYGRSFSAWGICAADDAVAVTTLLGNETDQTNARRIVACVNACRGFSTEYLEAVVAEGESLQKRKIDAGKSADAAVATLTRRCDELLEALRTIAVQSLGEDWTPEQAIQFVRQHARSAIMTAETRA